METSILILGFWAYTVEWFGLCFAELKSLGQLIILRSIVKGQLSSLYFCPQMCYISNNRTTCPQCVLLSWNKCFYILWSHRHWVLLYSFFGYQNIPNDGDYDSWLVWLAMHISTSRPHTPWHLVSLKSKWGIWRECLKKLLRKRIAVVSLFWANENGCNTSSDSRQKCHTHF